MGIKQGLGVMYHSTTQKTTRLQNSSSMHSSIIIYVSPYHQDKQKASQYDPGIHFHSSTTWCRNTAAGKYPIS